ncbi:MULTISPECIES: NADH-quinone oxidoreductase subunit NuoE [Carboxydothermus]|uniref:Fe-hydrogenase, gamma subunit n=2 Tax=Carboxydothermus TaxID=129957 RepID=Q3AE49_CARHZ|nr:MULTISPECIES: NADH-quinone oxidoreductase subunit NuoE [Carboxydothermus]ABB15586.1 Fe-hydrogenase, gamma subunit [Carboxydothermus hydrogenoformans Z-2901]NYE56598.1 NADH-quinone oxidoreductase subunit E [Carboxydothermus ferrireducens DSM 11255]
MVCACGKEVVDPKKEKLKELLSQYQGQKGALIPVLQGAQEIYGYLPREVMEEISRSLKIPFSKVYGVATFYAQFHLKPRGRNVIRACLGTACHVRGGAKVFETLKNELGIGDGETTPDLRFTLESVACIGACGLAPVIMVNNDTYGRLTPDKVKEILAKYE